MARAGGQIMKDVLRRKLNAKHDNPMYDDQGQEMSTFPGRGDPGFDPDERDDGQQYTKRMRNPNPDGTFDGPSGGRPVADNYGDAPSDLEMRDEEDMDMEPDGDADDPIAKRLQDAGMAASHGDGGDGAIVDGVAAEAERMGAEGIPLEQVLGAAGEPDGYAFTDKEMQDQVLSQAWQKGASGNIKRGMGKPIGPGQ